MQIALVGYNGYWGSKLARVLGLLGHEVVDWIDRTNSEQLSKSEADAAIIATPPNTHYKLGMAALNNEMHVLIEKPMALRYGQARALADKAEENDLVLSVDSTFCHTQAFEYLEKLEEPVISYQSIRLAPPMPRAVIPAGWDLIVHDLSILDAFGVQWENVVFHGHQDGSVAQASFILPSGGSAFIMASRCWPTKERSITIHFPSGTYFWTLQDLYLVKPDGQFTHILSEDDEPLQRLLKDFEWRCKGQALSGRTDGRHGTRVIGALEKLYPMVG